MKRLLISLQLSISIIAGTHGAVTQPGIGFVKPDVQHDHFRQIPSDSDDQLLIIIVDRSAFEADGYYIFLYRQKTLVGAVALIGFGLDVAYTVPVMNLRLYHCAGSNPMWEATYGRRTVLPSMPQTAMWETFCLQIPVFHEYAIFQFKNHTVRRP